MKKSSHAQMRWLRHVVDSPTDQCVEWPFGKGQNGYGMVRVKGKQSYAHRVALQLHTNASGDGMHACHAPKICHNTACVNPLHLRWATRAENQADRVLDGTSNRGHRNGSVRLTADQVADIYSSTESQAELSERFSVSQPTISDIRNHRTWAWLTQKDAA